MTFEKGLGGVPDRVISETAKRFISNEIPGQSATFAPSVAEFVKAARSIPTDTLPRLPKPEPERQLSPAAKARMRLKMPMFQHANECGLMDQLDAANKAGFSAMAELAGKWGVPVPEELLSLPPVEAERQWANARNQAWADIHRNPPPFMRRQPRYSQAA
ncbi:MAG TPA: hypothetical protein VJL90_12785 [Pseudorhodoplanes sp.]|nr:hypothetical protein [Pseudorhodoplanes sp.]